MTKITALAVDNLDLLHRLDAPGADDTVTRVGHDLGRDQSNLTKTLKRLREEGVIAEGLTLTDAGRSLTRLIAADGEVLADDATLLLRHDQIEPDPENARTDYDPFAINALAADILARSRPGRVGLLHALTVLPPAKPGAPWRLRGGYRRWLAIRNLIERFDEDGEDMGEGLPPAAPIPCVRHDGVDGVQAVLMAIVENVQREDLHPLDEGAAYARLIGEFHMSADAIAAAVQKSKKHVADRVAIVEKLDDEAKRRMRLPSDDDSHLTYAGARKEMQALNARPKPPVDVTPKEALALLEVVDRVKRRPSRDGAYAAKNGFTQIHAAPAGGAASSLVGKGLIEIAEPSWGSHAFVRIDPNKRGEVGRYVDDKGAMGLWHARAEVLGTGVVGELEQSGRYATPWLNDPLPEPEPASSPQGQAPAPAAPTPPAARLEHLSPHPPAAAREADRAEGVVEGAQGGAPEPRSEEIPASLLKLAGVPETPKVEAPDLHHLTDAELTILADIAAKIAAEPVAGRADPQTGKPAFVGCAILPTYYKDSGAMRLVTERLIAFVPSARDVQMCAFTPRGRAWIELHTHTPHKPPYATAWLNPPEPEAKIPAAPELAAPEAPEILGYALPIIAPPSEVLCSSCECAFELSQDCTDLASTEQAHFFEFEGRPTVECPNCQTQLRLAGAVVTHVDREGQPL